MDDRFRQSLALLLGLAGLMLVSGFGIAGLSRSLDGRLQLARAVSAISPAPATQPTPLNKREQLFVRMKTPVTMPDDLVAAISQKDPKMSAWVEAWNKDHMGTEQKDSTWLAPLLSQTNLSASDLWRLCRQIDRGGVSDACRYIAAAAARHAESELDSGTVTVNASYINELSRLRIFLMLGVWQDTEALDVWADVILKAPAKTRTPDIEDAARLGHAWAKFAREDYTGASKVLDDLRAAANARAQGMSDTTQNELNYFCGNIAYQERHYEEALAYYEAVPHVDSDDAIYAMEYSAFALAQLGRLDDAKHRLAEFIVRYHFDENGSGRFSDSFADKLASDVTRIASGADVPLF
jgi:hypothetical protein